MRGRGVEKKRKGSEEGRWTQALKSKYSEVDGRPYFHFAVHSAKLEPPNLDNGDMIDCVDFYSQPAMRDRRIRRNPQSRANFMLQGTIAAKNKTRELASDRSGGIDLEEERCPPGTVPFLKATKAGPLNFSAIDDLVRSRAKFFSGSRTVPLDLKDLAKEREYAVVKATNGKYNGAEGTLNVWAPVVEIRSEISVMQIWVVGVSGGNVMTLEAGWMVNPIVFGDFASRFFFFTTNSSYKTTLYGENKKRPVEKNNLQFVRQSNYMPFGKALTTSNYGGRQHAIKISIKTNEHEDWDLSIDGNLIGFWPKENYDGRFSLAIQVDWGGEIVNKRSTGKHTITQMGSGHFPQEGIGKAAYISNMALFDENMEVYNPTDKLQKFSTVPNCYDVIIWPPDNERGCYVTLGGPGYDKDRCP
ncbi:uncharacterized protein LOC116267011 [Nymphaea colorata]|nr:uncharacterized protein LOC116267011 [Nymphaea colorata]